MKKNRNKNINLDKEMNELKKENISLKRKLGKLRKDANLNQDILISNQELASLEIEIEKKESKIKCERCGGEIKRFKVFDRTFDVCQKCKNRNKVI